MQDVGLAVCTHTVRAIASATGKCRRVARLRLAVERHDVQARSRGERVGLLLSQHQTREGDPRVAVGTRCAAASGPREHARERLALETKSERIRESMT